MSTQAQNLGVSLEGFRTQVTQAAREPLLTRIAELEEINTQLCEQADVAANAYADLKAQLVKEAARTAEEKLRADQMTKQHDMQAKMHQEAAQDASILQYLLSNAKYHEWDGGYCADFDISINADVNGVRADSAKAAVQNILAAQAKQGGQANG